MFPKPKYRVVKNSKFVGSYDVEKKVWWWPWWTTTYYYIVEKNKAAAAYEWFTGEEWIDA